MKTHDIVILVKNMPVHKLKRGDRGDVTMMGDGFRVYVRFGTRMFCLPDNHLEVVVDAGE